MRPPTGALRKTAAAVGTFLDRTAVSCWFAYVTILFLQLKVVWGIWLFRDLTAGDTSSYFVDAFGWYQHWSNVICWSPLYTAFYGSFLFLSRDAYLATIAHRLVIVLTLAILVLALMRALLPPALAWLAAAWWVVLPINFDSAYEVHLFAVIPVLAAWLAILSKDDRYRKGLSIGILLASALLVRNELAVAAALLAGIILVWEFRRRRQQIDGRIGQYIMAYAAPIVIAGLLFCLFYSHSRVKYPELSSVLKRKHTLNICQVFAFGYEQRSADWHKSPWTECQPLMQRFFGKPEPSLIEAFRSNPEAVMGHFRWNASLIPNGLEVLLFNSMSGKVDPDYFPVRAHSRSALLCGLMLVLILAVGSDRILYRERHAWWESWLQKRIWGWMAMGCVASTVVIVMITQRPRPSYMFSLGLMVMAAAATCVYAIVHRQPMTEKWRPALPVLAVLLIILVPPYYQHGSRPLLEGYRRLNPFAELLERPGVVLVTPGYGAELCNYLRDSSLQACQGLYYYDLRAEAEGGRSWSQVLDTHNVNFLYANEAVLRDPSIRPFLSDPVFFGWKVIGLELPPSHRWMLLQRVAAETKQYGRSGRK